MQHSRRDPLLAPTLLASTLLPDAVPRSRPPRRPYVWGTVLHRPDGSRLPLDLRLEGRWTVTSIVPAPGGYLVTDDRWFEGTVGMHRLDAYGVALDSWESTGPALLGPDGQVAWVRVPVPGSAPVASPRLHVGDRVQELPGHHQPYLLGFDGARVVCSARILPGPARRTFETSVPGVPCPVVRPEERVPSPGRRHWWRWTDGSLELGRDDTVLVRWEDSELFSPPEEPVWEDEEHLLATLVQGGREALMRLGVDGSVTRATPWVTATVAGHAVLPGTSGRASGDD